MSEKKQLAIIVIASLIIGIIGLMLIAVVPPLFEGNLVVDSYEAVLYENGTLTEHYTYDVRDSGRVPYALPFMGGPPRLQFHESTINSISFGRTPRGNIWLCQG